MSRNKNYFIIGITCLIKAILHLIADFHSGFQGDELLHIDARNHLSVGYMEFPPFIGFIAFLQNLIGSNSVFVHHIFPHLATLAIIVIVGKITLELGGRTKALILVMVAILAAPAFTRTHQLFQPVVFSQLFWLLGFLVFIKFVKTFNKKYLFLLALTLAIGFLNKYDIVFFAAGCISLLFFSRTRSVIVERSSLIYISLFVALISPNITWQIINDFPILQHVRELYDSQLNEQSVQNFFTNLFVQLNPFAVFFYLTGLVYVIIIKKDSQAKTIAYSILISMLLLVVSKGKPYYFFPVMICLIILGSIWLEHHVFNRRKWLLYTQIILLVISGAFMLPYGMPIMNLDRFISYADIQEEENRLPILFEEFYSKIHWNNVLVAIQKTYKNLPQSERQECIIWGKHYKQAGAINLFAREYTIVEAISYHGSYYKWAPAEGNLPETVIAVSNQGVPKEFWFSFFSLVEEKAKIHNKYADEDEDEWTYIYVCLKPKTNFAQLKETFKNRIFE